jgi:hypothetical protein
LTITGAGAESCVEQLESVIDMDVQRTEDGRVTMDSGQIMGPLTLQQQTVLDATTSPDPISLYCTSGDFGNYLFAKTNGGGDHEVNATNTEQLNAPSNKTSYKGGNVVLHEIAEGLAEVKNPHANFDRVHSLANKVSPGFISGPPTTGSEPLLLPKSRRIIGLKPGSRVLQSGAEFK